MALAAGLRLPLVLVIDTAGPALSAEAEQGGLAGEIARCLAELVTLDTPTVSVLLGQGSGGPALAMVPADRVLAALHGWLAPLPPEGASAIVFRDVDHAPELAAAQGIRSVDLLRNGIVDAIVPEHPDAADEPEAFTRRLSATIAGELHRLRSVPTPSATPHASSATGASGSPERVFGVRGRSQRDRARPNHSGEPELQHEPGDREDHGRPRAGHPPDGQAQAGDQQRHPAVEREVDRTAGQQEQRRPEDGCLQQQKQHGAREVDQTLLAVTSVVRRCGSSFTHSSIIRTHPLTRADGILEVWRPSCISPGTSGG